MRVVSLVPSWTETLLDAGVGVIGRTRFCIHPKEKTDLIPVVGGTKDLDLGLLEELKPDLLLLDKEENLPWMAETRSWNVHVSHVDSVRSMPGEARALAEICGNAALERLAVRWEKIIETHRSPREGVSEIPGIVSWVKKPSQEPETVLYMVWRGPWMAVSRNTFIGSMLAQLGYGDRLPAFSEKYPKIDLNDFDPAKTLILFSTEPYPFLQKKRELESLEFPSAVVDGESFGWFGLRALRFLEESV